MSAIMLTLSIVVSAPIMFFAAQCLLALIPHRRNSVGSSDFATVVLMPAHNEAEVIGHTLERLLPTLNAAQRVLVVADNCSDDTAEICRRQRVEVIERQDPVQRGKGFAISFGVEHLVEEPPRVVVILDADCNVEDDTIDRLAGAVVEHERPVQGLNLTSQIDTNNRLQAVAVLGNRLTNYVRPLGSATLNMPCRLLGTGMALPWSLLAAADLATGNLVEDMQLGIDLARAGHPARFCREARVTSSLPSGDRAFASQRRRWEHGHLATAVREVPRLIWAGLSRLRIDLLWLAFDLSVPPIALLLAAWLAAAMATAVAALVGWVDWLPAVILAASGSTLFFAVAVSWLVFCRREVPLRTLAAIPRFLLAKLPIYSQFLAGRQREWVRTERREQPTSAGRNGVRK